MSNRPSASPRQPSARLGKPSQGVQSSTSAATPITHFRTYSGSTASPLARWRDGRSGFARSPGGGPDSKESGRRRQVTRLLRADVIRRLPLARAENFTVSISKDKVRKQREAAGTQEGPVGRGCRRNRKLAVAAVHLDSGASSARR